MGGLRFNSQWVGCVYYFYLPLKKKNYCAIDGYHILYVLGIDEREDFHISL